MTNIIFILMLLMILLLIPNRDIIRKKINNIVEPTNNSLMNKKTTGVDRGHFEVPDDLPYLDNFNSKPFRYRRMEIDPLPEGKILDDRDPNLRQFKNNSCFSN